MRVTPDEVALLEQVVGARTKMERESAAMHRVLEQIQSWAKRQSDSPAWENVYVCVAALAEAVECSDIQRSRLVCVSGLNRHTHPAVEGVRLLVSTFDEPPGPVPTAARCPMFMGDME